MKEELFTIKASSICVFLWLGRSLTGSFISTRLSKFLFLFAIFTALFVYGVVLSGIRGCVSFLLIVAVSRSFVVVKEDNRVCCLLAVV